MCGIISEVGFKCTLCGKCCTREFNDHVFLLAEDIERGKSKFPGMVVPAPYFEICDQNGCFYVSGYALKVKENGDCVFLDNDNRCRIYNERFLICRIYPYMLHREKDESGRYDWRQISGLNEHGEYNYSVPEDECRSSARETINYEMKYLMQSKKFYEKLMELFLGSNLRPVRKKYDEMMRRFEKGEEVVVFAFNGTSFDKVVMKKTDFISAGYEK
nr:YkgJ family cysteine cluster protein [Methanomicrobium sp. W14]